MATQERLLHLFDKYLHQECTPQEVGELVALLQRETTDDRLSPRMQELWKEIKQEQRTYPVDWRQMYERIKQEGGSPVTSRHSVKRIILRVAAAVAVIMMLSGGWYLWHQNASLQKENIATTSSQRHDVHPGGNKAVLTLANGATIVLDQAANGTLAKQGHSQVIKIDSGELAYQPTEKFSRKENISYNKLTTPRGGQYRLRLPDGTEVWLNAASSIRYPTAFSGKERQVEITGEAYFEVAQVADKPFIVTVNNMKVKVLGTHFNINAYANEGIIKTTLLEGKIKIQSVNGNKKSVIITPGEQVQMGNGGQMKLVKEADVDEVVAWKNGLFVFHQDDLPSIMRRIARWYDVQVEYKAGKAPASHFTGAIRRQVNISEVLKMLKLAGGADFVIEGRKIIVAP